jgi:hypothetical protein
MKSDFDKALKIANLPMPRTPGMLTPEDFDEMNVRDLVAAIDREVDTYIGVVGRVVKCKDGVIRVRVRLGCSHDSCRRWGIAYLRGGPHSGALCYAYDTNGNFLADLRNQNYVCSDHSKST